MAKYPKLKQYYCKERSIVVTHRVTPEGHWSSRETEAGSWLVSIVKLII